MKYYLNAQNVVSATNVYYVLYLRYYIESIYVTHWMHQSSYIYFVFNNYLNPVFILYLLYIHIFINIIT